MQHQRALGLHIIADLHGCTGPRIMLENANILGSTCYSLATACGLTPIAHLFHKFPDTPGKSSGTPPSPGGVTATVLLAESHICVHTWPESNSATLDIYVCNVTADNSANARELMDCLLALFRPNVIQRHDQHRGWRVAPPADAVINVLADRPSS